MPLKSPFVSLRDRWPGRSPSSDEAPNTLSVAEHTPLPLSPLSPRSISSKRSSSASCSSRRTRSTASPLSPTFSEAEMRRRRKERDEEMISAFKELGLVGTRVSTCSSASQTTSSKSTDSLPLKDQRGHPYNTGASRKSSSSNNDSLASPCFSGFPCNSKPSLSSPQVAVPAPIASAYSTDTSLVLASTLPSSSSDKHSPRIDKMRVLHGSRSISNVRQHRQTSTSTFDMAGNANAYTSVGGSWPMSLSSDNILAVSAAGRSPYSTSPNSPMPSDEHRNSQSSESSLSLSSIHSSSVLSSNGGAHRHSYCSTGASSPGRPSLEKLNTNDSSETVEFSADNGIGATSLSPFAESSSSTSSSRVQSIYDEEEVLASMIDVGSASASSPLFSIPDQDEPPHSADDSMSSSMPVTPDSPSWGWAGMQLRPATSYTSLQQRLGRRGFRTVETYTAQHRSASLEPDSLNRLALQQGGANAVVVEELGKSEVPAIAPVKISKEAPMNASPLKRVSKRGSPPRRPMTSEGRPGTAGSTLTAESHSTIATEAPAYVQDDDGFDSLLAALQPPPVGLPASAMNQRVTLITDALVAIIKRTSTVSDAVHWSPTARTRESAITARALSMSRNRSASNASTYNPFAVRTIEWIEANLEETLSSAMRSGEVQRESVEGVKLAEVFMQARLRLGLPSRPVYSLFSTLPPTPLSSSFASPIHESFALQRDANAQPALPTTPLSPPPRARRRPRTAPEEQPQQSFGALRNVPVFSKAPESVQPKNLHPELTVLSPISATLATLTAAERRPRPAPASPTFDSQEWRDPFAGKSTRPRGSTMPSSSISSVIMETPRTKPALKVVPPVVSASRFSSDSASLASAGFQSPHFSRSLTPTTPTTISSFNCAGEEQSDRGSIAESRQDEEDDDDPNAPYMGNIVIALDLGGQSSALFNRRLQKAVHA